jgi:simple sugar transport system substrate-binding protein/rhamnose transport system substrate-binding protein
MLKRITTITIIFLLAVGVVFAKGGDQGGKPKVVVIPKLLGISYFNDSKVGAEAGAKEFGLNLIWDGPTEGSATEQAKIAEDYLAQNADAILIAPNDTKILEPTMKKVRSAGKIAINWDSEFDNSITNYSVVPIEPVQFGEMLFEEAAKACGGKGEFAILVANLQVADHNNWRNAGMAYFKEKYPDMKLVTDPIPTNESQEQAYSRTLELINTYPNLRLIIGISSVVAPGAAQAIREQGLQDKIQNVGTSLPSQVTDYLKDGSVDASVLWRPAEGGYVAMYAARCALDKTPVKDGTKLKGFGTGEVTIQVKNGNIVVPSKPLVFTKDNVENYDF